MGILFLCCFVVGAIAFFGNALFVIGQIVIALIKYVISPLIALFLICWLIKYGV